MTVKLNLLVHLFFFFSAYSYANQDMEITESHKCSQLFPYFEAKHTIPRNMLHSIALKESGKRHSKHKITIVWPWTVNVEGNGYYFNTKREAILFVKKQIIRGKENIDVGCMQINLKHHLDAFNNLNQAFDPKHNIAYGAKFLKSKYDQLGSWHKAIAHYHSATYDLGSKYKQEVIKIANNMQLYKSSIKLHESNNYYNKVTTQPFVQKIAKSSVKDSASFQKNSRKYKSNIMIAMPRK